MNVIIKTDFHINITLQMSQKNLFFPIIYDNCSDKFASFIYI